MTGNELKYTCDLSDLDHQWGKILIDDTIVDLLNSDHNYELLRGELELGHQYSWMIDFRLWLKTNNTLPDILTREVIVPRGDAYSVPALGLSWGNVVQGHGHNPNRKNGTYYVTTAVLPSPELSVTQPHTAIFSEIDRRFVGDSYMRVTADRGCIAWDHSTLYPNHFVFSGLSLLVSLLDGRCLVKVKDFGMYWEKGWREEGYYKIFEDQRVEMNFLKNDIFTKTEDRFLLTTESLRLKR